VEAIEFDVHLTADGRGVLLHDPTVDRTSNGTGAAATLSLEELQSLDAGSWFGAGFAGERLLSLEEALDLVPAAIRLNVHVKAYPGDRDRVVPLVVRELSRRGRLGTAFVASDQESLAMARRVEPEVEICNLSTDPPDSYVRRSEGIGCRILQPGSGMTTPVLVVEAHRRGMEVNPFYADEEAEMLRLIECGVDGVLTNQPERLQSLLRRLGG
jgi:glycerophosphoryl diester phosphodiesterase